ncbi:DUF4192 family protein [Streptomyces sp. BE303]|uniref:DUF4192 family protein n=1 Tax=Streptomyces sp. BE303 TaxID=3002528 RepID=UPI002E7815DB|nr:DUF4192 family protein [Streptomyces sp. BE303]MED7951202.1 DUF4192 family protein [Streptomyces sp. BE303]
MNNERIALPFGDGPGGRPITMRGPADMAELLPYLLGFFPDDSIVAVGLGSPDLRQGGVIRLDIPESPEEWPAAAEETADLLVGLSEQQGERPVQVLLYLCQDPGRDHGPPTDERLRPLAERLRLAFESRGVRVKEALCVSAGRWWSFLCRRDGCSCDPAGNPIGSAPGPGPVAVAATVAGLAPRGSRKEIVAGLAPVGPPAAGPQRRAIARAEGGPTAGRRPSLGREESARLLDGAVAAFMAGAVELDEDRTARLLLVLQDRVIRDRAAEYARPAELASAQRLWRFLATRCVPPYTGYAPPPLTLLAWVSWVAGDTATARVVLAHTLRLAPSYLLAQLLYESLNGGFTVEPLLASVETERRRRTERERTSAVGPTVAQAQAQADGGRAGTGPGGEAPDAAGPVAVEPVEVDHPDTESAEAEPAGGEPTDTGPGGAGAGDPAPPDRAGGSDRPGGSATAKARRRRRRGRRARPEGSPPSGGASGPVPGAAPDSGHPTETPPEPAAVVDATGRSGSSDLAGPSGAARVRGGRTGAEPVPRLLPGLPGCRPAERPRSTRRARISRSSPWAAPVSPTPARRGRCRGVRSAPAGARTSR